MSEPVATPTAVPYHPQKITYTLTESYEAMPNPGKGWVAYVFDLNNPEAANMGPLVSTLYTNNVSWGDLEPEKGQYRWDKLDRLVQMAKRNGIKFRFSLNSVDPTTACPNYRPQIPYWYLVTYPSSGRWINTWYGNPISSTVNPYGNPGWVFEPDYASAAYTSEYFRFLTALASYWRSNPDWMDTIEGMEISNYGLWGEWHSDFPWTSPSVKATVLSGMVDWYFALFPEARTGAQPRMEISALFTGLGESGVSHAVQMGADMARKCMGICFHGYISQADYDAVNSYRFWRSFRGEWGSWTGAIDNFFDRPNGSYVTSTKGAIDEALYNFKADRLGWYVHSTLSQQSGVAGQTFAEYFQSRSGYRLYVSQVSYPDSTKPGETFTVDTRWYQRGVSKLYLPSKFAVDLDGGPNARYPLGEVDFDATNWQLGPQGPIPLSYTFKIPNNVPPGRYDVRIGLVDSKRRPMINLANAGKESSNPKQYTFYAAGAVEVLAK